MNKVTARKMGYVLLDNEGNYVRIDGTRSELRRATIFDERDHAEHYCAEFEVYALILCVRVDLEVISPT